MSIIQQGLLISAIGMGLVFVVIIFLWGLMALMMRLTSVKRKPDVGAVSETTLAPEISVIPEMQTAESQRRAAAAAVAVLMAMASQRRRSAQNSQAETALGMNPWQSYHRERQLENRNLRG
jgi:Na+-transporting methylmalonyl-CoA/oxaloacetate decarboxylase gamma subunit